MSCSVQMGLLYGTGASFVFDNLAWPQRSRVSGRILVPLNHVAIMASRVVNAPLSELGVLIVYDWGHCDGCVSDVDGEVFASRIYHISRPAARNGRGVNARSLRL